MFANEDPTAEISPPWLLLRVKNRSRDASLGRLTARRPCKNGSSHRNVSPGPRAGRRPAPYKPPHPGRWRRPRSEPGATNHRRPQTYHFLKSPRLLRPCPSRGKRNIPRRRKSKGAICVAATSLRFAMTSPPSGCQRDFHPQAVEHARHKKKAVSKSSGDGLRFLT